MKRFIVFVYSKEPKDVEEEQEIVSLWERWLFNLRDKGLLEGGEPYSGKGIEISGSERETRDVNGEHFTTKGYLIIKAKSFASITKLLKSSPNLSYDGSVVVHELQSI